MPLGRSVEELLHTVSARELQDWIAYWNVEPWGAYRDNLHMATLAALTFNVNRGKGERSKKPEDFMYREQVVADDELKTLKFVAELRALAKPRKRK